MDWFLYDRDLRNERVKQNITKTTLSRIRSNFYYVAFFFVQKAVNFLFSQKSSILDIRVGLEVMNKIYDVKAIHGSPVANV